MYSRWAIPSGSMLSLHRILLVCKRGYGEKYSRHIYKRHETEMWLNLLLFSTNEGLSRGTQDRVPQGLEIVPQASVHRSQWKYRVNSKERKRINCNYFNSQTYIAVSTTPTDGERKRNELARWASSSWTRTRTKCGSDANGKCSGKWCHPLSSWGSAGKSCPSTAIRTTTAKLL